MSDTFSAIELPLCQFAEGEKRMDMAIREVVAAGQPDMPAVTSGGRKEAARRDRDAAF